MVYVAHQRRLVGLIEISVRIRPEAAGALDQLRHAGVSRLVMLTGDLDGVAEHVASSVGVTEWRSRLLPEDKFEAIRKMRASGRRVAMVGDGINDASALAIADVGFAMGAAGSDVAVETADVALASDDLRHVADVIHISRRTMSVVRQNYALALGVNSIGLYLAAAGSINPIIAALLHNLSTILVVLNSSGLIGYDPTQVRAKQPEGSPLVTRVEEKKHTRRGKPQRRATLEKKHFKNGAGDLSGDQMAWRRRNGCGRIGELRILRGSSGRTRWPGESRLRSIPVADQDRDVQEPGRLED